MGSSPEASVFGQDMLFEPPYQEDWGRIGHHCQRLVNDANDKEDVEWIDYYYIFRDKVLIIYEKGVDQNAKDKHIGPFSIILLCTNHIVWIKHGA